MTQPDAGKRLFRETVERYLGENPTANQEQRRAEIRKEIKTRLSEAGLDDETLRGVLDRVTEDGEER